jgi:hypothetical protein
MSNLQDNKLTIEQLLGAVKQLSPAELQKFTSQFLAWQKQNGTRIKHREILEHKSSTKEETALLGSVDEFGESACSPSF